MRDPKVGDYVKVEYEGFVAHLDRHNPQWLSVKVGDLFIGASRNTVTVISPPLPIEPEVGSVVLTKGGRAWQRNESGEWVQAGASLPWSWAELNDHGGPLTLLNAFSRT